MSNWVGLPVDAELVPDHTGWVRTGELTSGLHNEDESLTVSRSAGRSRLPRLVSAVILAGVLGSPTSAVGASPVLTDPVSEGPPVEDRTADEAAFGEVIDVLASGLLVQGRSGFDITTATLMVDGDDGLVASTTITSNGTIAGRDTTVVAIDHDGDDAVLKRYLASNAGLDLVQEIPLEDVGEDYGHAIAVSDQAIVVTRPNGPTADVLVQDLDVTPETDAFDIFVPGDDGHFWLAQTIETELCHLHASINGDGSIIAISGSEPFASQGAVEVYYGADATHQRSAGPRFDDIGGGPVLIDGADVFVQRDGYFSRGDDTWTMLRHTDDGLAVGGSVPAKGSVLSVGDDVIAVGSPASERVLTFGREPNASGSFPFLQSITPGPDSSGRFGSSIVVRDGAVIVGTPGLIVDGVGNEGGLTTFALTDGPVGCTIVGTAGDDVIEGTKQRDVICGLAGNDEITGLGGNDIIYGGPGDDIIEGNSGHDRIIGGDGYDRLYGGSDNDFIYGEGGVDEIFGGAGDDHVFGGDGIDIIHGGGNDDSLYGQNGDDRIFGGEDNDFIDGGSGNDLVRGGDDEDTLYGGPGNDQLFAGQGDDIIAGGRGYDEADGGHNTDWCDNSTEVCKRSSWEDHASNEDPTGRD